MLQNLSCPDCTCINNDYRNVINSTKKHRIENSEKAENVFKNRERQKTNFPKQLVENVGF